MNTLGITALVIVIILLTWIWFGLGAGTGPDHAEHSATDDLTRIKGIGRVLEKKLHKLGITSYAQIAKFDADDRARVNDVLNFRGRIEREKWVQQATVLTRG